MPRIMAGMKARVPVAPRPTAVSAGPGQKAAQSPADTENRRAGENARVDVVARRQVETVTDNRFAARQHEAVADERHQHCPAHDEGERGVPGAEQVEEVQDLGRVGHAGDDETCAEEEAKREIDDEGHGLRLR